MTRALPDVEACLFDVFGTIVDWRDSVANFVGSVFSSKGLDIDPDAFADHWRGCYQPAMENIRSGSLGYVPLDDLHFENLTLTLKHFGIFDAFSVEERWQLNRAWENLTPWPDVMAGLLGLKQGRIIAPCSNGSIALMSRLAKNAGLPWDCILGADLARDYKPQPTVYLACCDALRLPPGNVMMVAAHNSDLEAAQAVGLRTCFIARPTEYGPQQKTDLEPTGDWDLTIASMEELPDALGPVGAC